MTSSWPSGRVVAPVVRWISSSARVFAIWAAFSGSLSWARIVRIRVVSLAVARTAWPSFTGSATPSSWAVDFSGPELIASWAYVWTSNPDARSVSLSVLIGPTRSWACAS